MEPPFEDAMHFTTWRAGRAGRSGAGRDADAHESHCRLLRRQRGEPIVERAVGSLAAALLKHAAGARNEAGTL